MQAFRIVVSGIAQGCIYGLIALGVVLIYKATETVSFAQGEMMMRGAFLGLVLMTSLGFSFCLAFAAAVTATAAFDILPERLVNPADPRPAGVLDRDADDRHRLHGAWRVALAHSR